MKMIFLKQRISHVAITLLAVNPKLETMTGYAWWKTLFVQSIGHIFLFAIMIPAIFVYEYVFEKIFDRES